MSLREASEILGVSVEAVRKRVKRDSLRSDKGPDGRVYVYLDAGGDAPHPEPEVESSEKVEMVGELRDRVRSLERMLEQEQEARTEERRRHDTLMAQLMQRIPAIEASEAPDEPGAPQTAEEEQGRGEPRSGAGEAQEGVRRPWWRRVFGD